MIEIVAMRLKLIPLFIFLFTNLCIKNIVAQDVNKGYVRIRIFGFKNTLCKIDNNSYIINDTILHLTIGKHQLKAWLPTTSLIDTTIQVNKTDTSKYVLVMEYSQNYLKYKRDDEDYKRLREKRLFTSPIFISLSLGLTVLTTKKANSYYDKALKNKDEYSQYVSQSYIDNIKTTFENNKKKYKVYSSATIGLYSLSALLAANYIRILLKQHHAVRPKYNEGVLLSKTNLNLFPSFQQNKLLLGLSINF